MRNHLIRAMFAILCLVTMIGAVGAAASIPCYSDEEGGCVFLGWYEAGQFIASPQLAGMDIEPFESAVRYSARAILPSSQTLVALARTDGRSNCRCGRQIWNPDLTSHSIEVGSDRRQHLANVLFSTNALPVHLLQSHNSSLSPQIESQLRNRADELWREHLGNEPRTNVPRSSRWAVRKSNGSMEHPIF